MAPKKQKSAFSVAAVAWACGALVGAVGLSAMFNLNILSLSIFPETLSRLISNHSLVTSIERDTTYGDCLVLHGGHRVCEKDRALWSESLIHPALLFHNAPRSVLILGSLNAPLVRQTIRHFLVSTVVWVQNDDNLDSFAQSNIASIYHYEDIPPRVQIVHSSIFDYLTKDREKFDIIIFDNVMFNLVNDGSGLSVDSRYTFLRSKLNDGGVVATRSGPAAGTMIDHYKVLQGNFKRVYTYTQFVPSTGVLWGLHIMTNSDLHHSPSMLSPSYVDALVKRRIVDGTEDLEHYDGISHLNMFALPKWFRQTISTAESSADVIKKRKAEDFAENYAPSEAAADLRIPVNIPEGSTITREYYGCDDADLESVETLRSIIQEGLEYAHAHIIRMDVVTSENITHTAVEIDKDKTIDSSVNRTRIRVGTLPTADSVQSTPEVMITVTLSKGHLTVRTYPEVEYMSAELTSYDSNMSAEEILGFLGEEVEAKRTYGSTIYRGSSTTSHPNEPHIDFWYHGTDYFMSHKVSVRESPTAGKGQFANEEIKAGEVIFKGPIEAYLRHDSEMQKMPHWRHAFIDHMGEQAEEDIWVAPPMYDDDDSYYTNHNCDPNLWYTGYDIMVARRNIKVGEELTFDYSTVDAEPESALKCKCGSPKCRKTVTGNDWMLPELQEAYGLEHFWPHIQRKILKLRQLRSLSNQSAPIL
ncbi:S-adenosyl-L-methionine-dependent methyltransferase [Paraphysoderma sedebokerense]|nr:S-adenosyl-L-methionine-dependent methyltransferase [Paraphysoderma sedebokerense]